MIILNTPEQIKELNDNEVFVFGSNKNGEHYGGAARVAYDYFGAQWGVSEGLTGKSYAIPTLDENMNKVSIDSLKKSIYKFIVHVTVHSNKVFYLTKIGCGIAGWSIDEVRDIFWDAMQIYKPSSKVTKWLPENLIIPIEFK
jgi:hypothetical protein